MFNLSESQIENLLTVHCQKVINDMSHENLMSYCTIMMMESFMKKDSLDTSDEIDFEKLIADIWYENEENDELTSKFIADTTKINLHESTKMLDIIHASDFSICH